MSTICTENMPCPLDGFPYTCSKLQNGDCPYVKPRRIKEPGKVVANRVHVGLRTHDYLILPSIGILDMDAANPCYPQPYRFRLAFAFWNWRLSVDIGRRRAWNV